jgi:hypothetical protein
MSEQRLPAPQSHTDLESLSQEDSAWLADRLVEYRDLLDFLRAN